MKPAILPRRVHLDFTDYFWFILLGWYIFLPDQGNLNIRQEKKRI